jgi:hypothetical protein
VLVADSKVLHVHVIDPAHQIGGTVELVLLLDPEEFPSGGRIKHVWFV